MNIVRLSSSVRFRREAGYVLICDLSTLQDYTLPTEMYEMLVVLRGGYDADEAQGQQRDLVADLEQLGLLTEKKPDPRLLERVEYE